jgi:hypothetical protein
MPETQMVVSFSRHKLDVASGDPVDGETRERLRRFLSSLAEWTSRLDGPSGAGLDESRYRTNASVQQTSRS